MIGMMLCLDENELRMERRKRKRRDGGWIWTSQDDERTLLQDTS